MRNDILLSIVIPCYNEEEVIKETIENLTAILEDLINKKKISKSSFMLFVDDGSTDKTWKIIESFSTGNKYIKAIKLSKNQGHQIALIAGLEYVANKCDAVITIDADLQQDPRAIYLMIEKFREGYEIVYGVKLNRKGESFFKKIFSENFYKIMNIMGVKVIFNHADYRLLSQRAINFLLQYSERNLFLRAIIPQLGLSSIVIYYEQFERKAGSSKYSLKKMLNFAWDGITSFSVMPLRIISILGFVIFSFSLLMSFYILAIKLFTNKAIPGWASMTLPIYFIGGIQLLALGIIGEYIGKIYSETKRRPRYFIEKEIN